MFKIIFVLGTLVAGLLQFQQDSLRITEQMFTREDLVSDLEFMFERFDEIHPNLYANADKNRMSEKIKIVVDSMSSGTRMDFWKNVAPLASDLNDGHTSLLFPSEERKQYFIEGGKLFPFEVYTRKGKLFIQRYFGENLKFHPGSEIISINKIPAKDIISKMKDYLSAERESFKEQLVSYNFHSFFWALFKSSGTFLIKYISAYDNEQYSAVVTGLNQFEFEFSKRNSLKETAVNLFGLEIFPEYNSALLKIGMFSYNNFFEAFVDSSMNEINKNNCEYLILDIRQNRGGNSNLGDKLITYFYDQPFSQFEKIEIKLSDTVKSMNWFDNNLISGKPEAKRLVFELPDIKFEKPDNFFEGEVFLLTSPFTFSSANAFASAFKCYEMGTIIGEETGGLTVSYSDLLTFKLPKTKLTAGVSHKRMFEACGNDNGRGVIPHHYVTPNFAAPDVDTVLNYTLDLIASKRAKSYSLNKN
ncbi:MAG: hypothetical protein K9J12_17865 [Melioribacteraceae bacterium]|nr:hypothetical protein [Melioribacteraceae bacterium]MCF8263515.1 hypothetical protein [Melioribacteraceae bacterium]